MKVGRSSVALVKLDHFTSEYYPKASVLNEVTSSAAAR